MAYEHAIRGPAGAFNALHATGGYPMLALGCPVYTTDGEKLGTVKEVRDTIFKVDAPRQFDYWLSTGGIRVVTAHRIDLAFSKDHVEEYKLSDDFARD